MRRRIDAGLAPLRRRSEGGRSQDDVSVCVVKTLGRVARATVGPRLQQLHGSIRRNCELSGGSLAVHRRAPSLIPTQASSEHAADAFFQRPRSSMLEKEPSLVGSPGRNSGRLRERSLALAQARQAPGGCRSTRVSPVPVTFTLIARCGLKISGLGRAIAGKSRASMMTCSVLSASSRPRSRGPVERQPPPTGFTRPVVFEIAFRSQRNCS